MAQWRRDERLNEIELAAGVPDAVAVYDAEGNLIDWDESAADAHLTRHGLSVPSD